MVPSQLPSDLQSAEFIKDLSFYANIIMSYIVCSLVSLALPCLGTTIALLRSEMRINKELCLHIEAKAFLLWLKVESNYFRCVQ